MSLHIAGPVEVQYEYEAMEPDELTIHVGDIIRNCRPIGKGWLEGELNGKIGVLPDNFVVKLGMFVYNCGTLHVYISNGMNKLMCSLILSYTYVGVH